jgi:hypothetical protein
MAWPGLDSLVERLFAVPGHSALVRLVLAAPVCFVLGRWLPDLRCFALEAAVPMLY